MGSLIALLPNSGLSLVGQKQKQMEVMVLAKLLNHESAQVD